MIYTPRYGDTVMVSEYHPGPTDSTVRVAERGRVLEVREEEGLTGRLEPVFTVLFEDGTSTFYLAQHDQPRLWDSEDWGVVRVNLSPILRPRGRPIGGPPPIHGNVYQVSRSGREFAIRDTRTGTVVLRTSETDAYQKAEALNHGWVDPAALRVIEVPGSRRPNPGATPPTAGLVGRLKF